MSPDVIYRDGELVFRLLKGEKREDHRFAHRKTAVANSFLLSFRETSARFPDDLKNKAVDALATFVPLTEASEFLAAAIERREKSKLTFSGEIDPKTKIYSEVTLKIVKNSSSEKPSKVLK